MDSVKVGDSWLVPSLYDGDVWYLYSPYGNEQKIMIKTNWLKEKYIWTDKYAGTDMKNRLKELLISKEEKVKPEPLKEAS